MVSIFCFGITTIDLIFHVNRLPSEGLKYRTRNAAVEGGGCASNAAVAIRNLGGDVSVGTRIGTDPISELILRDLQSAGIRTELVNQAEGGMAPFSSVAIDAESERQIMNFRGLGLVEDTAWLDSLPKADAYLTDTWFAPGAKRILELARKSDVPGIVDGEPTADPDAFRCASHVAFSSQGLTHLTGETDMVQGLKAANERFKNWVCVTDGPNGVHIMDHGKVEHVPAFEIDAKNSLGAGDVWHGAFALCLAEGLCEIDAVVFANAAAALRCSCSAGRDCYPDRKQVEALLRDQHQSVASG